MKNKNENNNTRTTEEQQDMLLKSYIELKDIADNLFIVSTSLVIGARKLFDNDITKVIQVPSTAKDIAPTPLYHANCSTSFSYSLEKINPEKTLSEKQLNEFRRFLTLAINDSVFPLDSQYEHKNYKPKTCNKIEILSIQDLDRSIKVELFIVNSPKCEEFATSTVNI